MPLEQKMGSRSLQSAGQRPFSAPLELVHVMHKPPPFSESSCRNFCTNGFRGAVGCCAQDFVDAPVTPAFFLDRREILFPVGAGLAVPELGVVAALGHELSMGAVLGDPAVGEHHNAVEARHR